MIINQTTETMKTEYKDSKSYDIKITKVVTSIDRKTGEIIKQSVVEEPQTVDARTFYLPFFESLHCAQLVECVEALKQDIFGKLFEESQDDDFENNVNGGD